MDSQDVSFGWALGRRVPRLPVWKRTLDVCVIVALSPALLFFGSFVAALVRLSSPGPVIFRQRRIGFQGREFTCLKFRTMRANAEADSHQSHTAHLIQAQAPLMKLDARHDPRLLPVGGFLRATGLDELPQLFNVLRGEMSIVGPRPCMPYEFELHKPWQRRRYNAVPGLTGLWQVSGKNRTTFDQMVQLDIKYGERLNLWLDLRIIAKTFPTLWKQCLEARAAKRNQTGAFSDRTE